jgi:hypothetical protein
MDVALALTLIGIAGVAGGLLADRTEFGAGLAASVKGRPYSAEEN